MIFKTQLTISVYDELKKEGEHIDSMSFYFCLKFFFLANLNRLCDTYFIFKKNHFCVRSEPEIVFSFKKCQPQFSA